MPRQGSKVAIALEAIKERPRTTRELGTLLECTCNAVRSMLLRPLARGVIVKVTDDAGRLCFAVPEAERTAPTAMTNDIKPPPQANRPSSSSRKTSGVKTPPPSAHRSSICQLPRDAQSSLIASFFLNGELTITANGECIRLDATQRQQLYSYLHKLRHVR